MNNTAIILAGGTGSRFKNDTPKQFVEFHGKPLWKIVYDKVLNLLPANNIVVVGKDVAGGETRSKSVMNGLNYFCNGNIDKVVILEAARPLVTKEQIRLLLENKSNSVTFVASCVDTIIKKDKTFLDRTDCLRLLTPQAFDFKLLKQAYDSGKFFDTTDETKVMYEFHHILPDFIDGGENLFKVTYPKDLKILEELYIENNYDE